MSQSRGPRPGVALTLLLLINLFNYIDRQVLAAVEPDIRRDLFAGQDEAFARVRMGMLSNAFLVTYMLAAPVFGMLAHRMSRWLLISFGVILWSLASGASGWPWAAAPLLAYWCLFATRCAVGVGEAAYGPIAPALLADMYPVERRGKIMSYFYLAIPVGGALGYALGEVVAKSLGWRWAFYLVVPPGILLGLWSFLMRKTDVQNNADHKPMKRSDYLTFVRTPSFVFNTLGMAGMTFAIGGIAFWMPDYLESRKVDPLFGLGPKTAFGAITVLAGLFATLAGGWAGDRLRGRFPGSYFLVSGLAMMLGFPMILLIVYLPFPMAWVFVFLAVFCLFFNTGPTNTVLANVTPSRLRAAGFAVNILIIHILGDVPSPPLMGWIAGHYGVDASFVMVSVATLVGGLFWLAGIPFLERDTLRASGAATSSS
ncbi:MAG: MFS transporter [Gemmataceae bacterium]|nr:MFS transporter [Gemmataceae bacterium]